MSVLIDQLIKEHSEIFADLTEANNLGIITEEGQNKLFSAKADLLVHLKNEDEHLYPILRKEAENNKHLEGILNSFSNEMKDISKSVMKFIDKYSDGVLDSKYVESFESIFATLSARMKKEESVLFAEYEKINQ
ncbi:MAG: hemerythrin domain-containing protein [Candidatus Scalindua sp.]|nr:hemerythrin domain-containing protein [Candidatus Scalindua sp.]MDV5166551.1 hemerythrin domain-containing protein [Candidatus Scalindua sp.]